MTALVLPFGGLSPDFVIMEGGLMAHQPLIDIYEVGDQPAVGTQQSRHNGLLFGREVVEQIQIVSVQAEHETCLSVGIVLVVYVATPFQNSECRVHPDRKKLVDIAELFYIELECLSFSAANAYLEEVCQMLVYIPDQVFWRECVVDAFPELLLIAGVVEQYGLSLIAVSANAYSLLEICFH